MTINNKCSRDYFRIASSGSAYHETVSPHFFLILFNRQIFHEMDLQTKKKFLIFLTGSDRIPIHGIHSIKIIIQKVKDNSRLN